MRTRPGLACTRPRARTRALLGLLLLPAVLSLAAFRPPESHRALARARIVLSGGELFPAPEMALQETPSDCGPTALHNLLRTLGVSTPGPAELARRSGTAPGGTRLGGLVRAARELGVPLRARRVTETGLSYLRTPFLAWYREGHFVTVLTVEAGGHLRIHDPGLGGYRLPIRAFRRRWGGVVADLARKPLEDSARVPPVGPDPRPPSHRR